MLRAAEARIASLPPSEAAEYRRLQAENATLAKDIELKQGELEAANREVSGMALAAMHHLIIAMRRDPQQIDLFEAQ
jgi:hypothetical protein